MNTKKQNKFSMPSLLKEGQPLSVGGFNKNRPVIRIVSLILSLAMLFTLTAGLDFTAFADDGVIAVYDLRIFYENGNIVPDFDDNDGKIAHVEYMKMGERLQLKYRLIEDPLPDNGRVEWESDTPSVCDVTADGLVCAFGESKGESARIYCRMYDKDGLLLAEDFVSVIVLPGLICSHQTKWQSDNEIIVKKCTICDEELSRLPFDDLGNYVYYGDFVEYTSVSNKFITGTNPPARTLFSPTTPITRAMFVTILYRMAGEPYANGGNPYTLSPFTDIKDTSVYYYDAACWALKNGVTTETTFKPFDNVSREQTASFLFRYAKDNGTVGDSAYKNVNLKSYPDFYSVHDWAVESIQWANYNGMITGTQQNTLNPQGATQRIHATKILYGFGKVCNIGNFA